MPAKRPKFNDAGFRLVNARNALALLKSARDSLRTAGADNAADYVAKAIKSAEGAVRHAQRLQGEAERAQS